MSRDENLNHQECRNAQLMDHEFSGHIARGYAKFMEPRRGLVQTSSIISVAMLRTVFRPGVLALRRTMAGKSHVNGVDIAYEKVGSGPRPLLLLPGALGCSVTDFGPQIKGLNREEFTTVAWDPRGYGHSIPPERDFAPGFFHRDASDAVQLMENLGFARFSLLGWSDGANTACIIAGKHPEKVEKLIIWGGNAYVTKPELATYEKIRDISTWSERMREPMVQLYGEEYFRKTWSAWVDGFMDIYEKSGGNVCMDEVKTISAPCLIIHGVKDAMVPSFHPEYFHKNIENSIIDYWEDGKHNLHLRFADRFNAQVEGFLMK